MNQEVKKSTNQGVNASPSESKIRSSDSVTKSKIREAANRVVLETGSEEIKDTGSR